MTLLPTPPAPHYGAYRSAREARDWVMAWNLALSMGGDEGKVARRDWWRAADLSEVARLAHWEWTGTSALDSVMLVWWPRRAMSWWSLQLGVRPLACQGEFGLATFGRRWARLPVKAVMPEYEKWAALHDRPNIRLAAEVWDALDSEDPALLRTVQDRTQKAYLHAAGRKAGGAVYAIKALEHLSHSLGSAEGVNRALEAASLSLHLIGEQAPGADKAWGQRWTFDVLNARRAEVLA